MPTEKLISIAVKRHTSEPKVLATCKGVRKAAGAAKKEKNGAKCEKGTDVVMILDITETRNQIRHIPHAAAG